MRAWIVCGLRWAPLLALLSFGCNGVLGIDKRVEVVDGGTGGTSGAGGKAGQVGADAGGAGTGGAGTGGAGTGGAGTGGAGTGGAGADGSAGQGGAGTGGSGVDGSGTDGTVVGEGGTTDAGDAEVARDASPDAGPDEAMRVDGDAGVDVATDAGCPPGDLPTQAGCAPIGAPRLLAPLSTATVTSRRPNLRWIRASGTEGAHVQICRDRGCASVITELDATGDAAAPGSDLPTGMLFWRAFGRAQGATGLVPSATWQFLVGARSAPINTSWGTTLDFNGDGRADLVVGAPAYGNREGRVYSYLGRAGGGAFGPLTASTTLTARDGHDTGFGEGVASAGDVNGDGFADVLAAAPGANASVGRVYLFLGSASGLVDSPAATLDPGQPTGPFGTSLASVGDVNGDGYGDVVVGAPFSNYVILYFGGPSGLSPSPPLSDIAIGFMAHYGVVSGGCDINGDGFSDVIVGAPYYAGYAFVYFGSTAGISSSSKLTLTSPPGPNSSFGTSVACIGDLDGDGYGDVAIGADVPQAAPGPASGQVFVYLGGPHGLGPPLTLVGPDEDGGHFGESVRSVGDVDGDGLGDIVVAAPAVNQNAGRAYLYLGKSFQQPIPTPIILDPAADDPNGQLGHEDLPGVPTIGGGDFDGDGYPDVAIGAMFSTGSTGRVYIYRGGATGLPGTPSFILVGPEGGTFGGSVASGS